MAGLNKLYNKNLSKKILSYFLVMPSLDVCKKAALNALISDGKKDITSNFIPKNYYCKAYILAKSNFYLCGMIEAKEIFKKRNIKTLWKFKEGDYVKKGQKICFLEGNAREILRCERTALNFLSILSGITTKSKKISEKYGKYKVAATRKTHPLLAACEKRAVMIGGCLSHRITLADRILVKDNHLAILRKLKKNPFDLLKNKQAEIEVSNIRDAKLVAIQKFYAILLDNLPIKKFRKIVRVIRKLNKEIIIEASGRIKENEINKYLKAGANIVSTSSLILNSKPADISLEISLEIY